MDQAPMSEAHLILAATDQPFRDMDAAEAKCRLMQRELGDEGIAVVEHPQGGYAVALHGADNTAKASQHGTPSPGEVQSAGWEPEEPFESAFMTPAPALAATGATSGAPGLHIPSFPAMPEVTSCRAGDDATASAKTSPYPDEMTFGVSWRAFIHLYTLGIIGLVLILMLHLPLLPFSGVLDMNNALLLSSLMQGIRLTAVVVAVTTLSKALYVHVLYSYKLTAESVEATFGFIARDAPMVVFAHVRSVKVVQTLWQRLWSVGDVALATGATDGHEVTLRYVASPKALGREMERRMRDSALHHPAMGD